MGLSLGLLGSGGSILAVPILRYTADLSAKEAVAGSLATVGAVSAIGALLAHREKRVAWRESLIFAGVATIGTLAGVEIADILDDRGLMGLFLFVMGYAVYRMLKKTAESEEENRKPLSNLEASLRAFAVGVLTGLIGVGGGFLIVPAMVALFHLSMKRATGSSLVVISVNSAVGLASYSQSMSLDWGFISVFAGCSVLGLLVGLKLSKSVSDNSLQRSFAYLLTIVFLYTLWKEFAWLLSQ